ncbi:hypothetical protein NKH28_03455 [Mesorhizobium sp. M1227]|uniref:hypothetical protein n=1 Tax=Mesorhizobium sp. M1227 TaxID=2957071 RepID=UPI00333B4973
MQKLGELRSPEKGQVLQKLHYDGETKAHKVSTINLDYLIYNRHNGRLEAEMLTWEEQNAVSPEGYDEDLHDVIEELLWQSAVQRNKATLADLKDKGQQRPGIVSLDGVIIDGNRRAMLLRRLEKATGIKQHFEAIILPHAYADNQEAIVRLETQYQLGEDAKVEYGALQKYLHVRRLHVDLGIPKDQIDKLMNEKPGNAARLLQIMDLMDEYLEHVGAPRLYTMLKDGDGSKEGMFVDLHGDLNRINGGKHKIPWVFDPDLDPLQLKLIQFDYIRLGELADAKKAYREISHQGNGNNFFAKQEIWQNFRDSHQDAVDPVTTAHGTLDEFIREHPNDYETKVDAARARDKRWSGAVGAAMKSNFGRSSYSLDLATRELKPSEYLRRAKELLEKIDLDGEALLNGSENLALAIDINRLTYAIKKRFDRSIQA